MWLNNNCQTERCTSVDGSFKTDAHRRSDPALTTERVAQRPLLEAFVFPRSTLWTSRAEPPACFPLANPPPCRPSPLMTSRNRAISAWRVPCPAVSGVYVSVCAYCSRCDCYWRCSRPSYCTRPREMCASCLSFLKMAVMTLFFWLIVDVQAYQSRHAHAWSCTHECCALK